VPPATGIVHQVNLEYLAKVVWPGEDGTLYPDSLVGTDSHTTMINGLGVVGWGVGGIEAEAVMLGQPIYMLIPQVVGVRLSGALPEGTTATDMVLRVTEMLRAHGVVGKFVEFFGPGLASMPLADRATIANMAPEYGATMGFFPVDDKTLEYMRLTGRDEKLIGTVEMYCREQALWRDDDRNVVYTDTLELDLATIEPSLAGPKRPQDRIALSGMQSQWRDDLGSTFGKKDEGNGHVGVDYEGEHFDLGNGDVVIAAITSCTNTSNPAVMVAAGLVARKALARGLQRKPWVKTSLAPGSKVVTEYYEKSGLDKDLDAMGFYTVGYGCTTCIGNSGPLPGPIATAVEEGDLVVASVLSGNRNFEGRINPHVRANYLASPPLVVAYAIAGTVDIDFAEDPIGHDPDGKPVFLKEIWPSQEEVHQAVAASISRDQFEAQYADVFGGQAEWKAIPASEGALYGWDGTSTYVQEPPFFVGLTPEAPPIASIEGARCLMKLGDSVTTDHISPAGAIARGTPAAQYLDSHDVPVELYNSYGSRRGNDRVMTRGTFANIRVRNQLAPGTEEHNIPLVVLAGIDYGMGSSRDWAAKGTYLLGVRAVIATSFERIHRSNLVGMGVLPLCFKQGDTHESLGLDGTETFSIPLDDSLAPRQTVTVTATHPDGKTTTFDTVCRIDTPVEVDYYRNGGILHTVLRKMAE
jgi:aconitate hydratase